MDERIVKLSRFAFITVIYMLFRSDFLSAVLRDVWSALVVFKLVDTPLNVFIVLENGVYILAVIVLRTASAILMIYHGIIAGISLFSKKENET